MFYLENDKCNNNKLCKSDPNFDDRFRGNLSFVYSDACFGVTAGIACLLRINVQIQAAQLADERYSMGHPRNAAFTSDHRSILRPGSTV